jgi:chemotaxis protein CheD
MPDRATVEHSVFLQPGEMFATHTPMRVKTIVGSCVAIAIRAPRLGFTVVAHCLLPHAGKAVDAIEAPRYVDTAVAAMMRMAAERGAASEDVEIKLFGGADTIAAGYGVGSRNVEAARKVFSARGLPLAAIAVGGNRGRVLEFDTASGDVFVKTLAAQTRGVPLVQP